MGRAVRTLRTALQQKAPGEQRICGSCLRSIQRRGAATAAAPVNPGDTVTTSNDGKFSPLVTSSATHERYNIKAGVVLSRPPMVTRDPTEFEKAFYLYQRRLNERLALNFTRYFYFPKDTPQEKDWKKKIKDRLTPARDIGKYRGLGPDGWNDELLVGAQESEPSHQWEALLEDARVEVDEESEGAGVKKIKEEVQRPMPRVTEADKSGDLKSLNRSLQRTLYLLVKTADGTWEFPSGAAVGKESIHRAAERVLVESGGINMNTWLVARHPVGWRRHNFNEPVTPEGSRFSYLGEKTFFIKGRIMAGQADLMNNKFGITDFRWLPKEEIKKAVSPEYWHSIKNMIVAQ